jgi:hypothetical protein
MATVRQATLSEAEIKKVLTGIQDLRRQYADAGPARGSRVKADRSAMQKALGPALAQAGLTVDRFETHRGELQEVRVTRVNLPSRL